MNIVASHVSTLLNNPLCGHHLVNDQGLIVDINDTLLGWLGFERNEVVGKIEFTDLMDGIGRLAFQKHFDVYCNAADFSQKLALILIRKNGTSLPVILNAIPVEDGEGNGVKKLYSTLDNSECRQALDKINNLNQELEAFTYSVSHDLRAPLRSIDGYSRILQEDYGEKLDEEGRRILNVVMNNAKRMGKLIDDLLDFARLGRKGVQRSKVHMTGLVNNVVRELLMQEPEGKINITIGELHTTFADMDMVRQVWISLIENAIKYTGKHPSPKIEISSFTDDAGDICFKVKDNGVGFDMKYASKLFGVFQRLHKMQDFSGTGVGLAIVKRIISRHDGRVWAEGALNEGAVFYFSIPNSHGNE